MQPITKHVTNPKKLLNSKWTAVTPTHKEKHFIVTKVIVADLIVHDLIVADLAKLPIEYIELEAIHSKRVQRLPWQQLNDTRIWRQGWV